MKFVILTLSLLVLQMAALGQTSETEPNDSYATASSFSPYNTYNASVGNGDPIDYHLLAFGGFYNFYLLVEATNISGSDAWLNLDIYDGRQGAGLMYSKTIANDLNIPDGETVYDTIYLCAFAEDNYYLAFTTNEEFDYVLTWYPVYQYANDEPNDIEAQAIPFAFNELKEGTLRYTYQGNAFDQIDWYNSGILPSGSYSNVNLNLTGINQSCAGGTKWIFYEVFKMPDNVTPFASGYIGNTLNAPQSFELRSTVPLSNMNAGDIFKVRLSSNAAFSYSLTYTDRVPYDDPEDNCCTYNAIPLAEDSVVGGNVGEYDYDNDEYFDEFDTYRIILPHAGTVKIIAVAELETCGGIEDPILKFDLLDKYGDVLISDEPLVSWVGPTDCGILKYDTAKIRAMAADTFYLQLRSDDFGGYPTINYNFRYQLIDSTGTDPEPNNDTTTAILVNPGQVKKGHINFKKVYGQNDNSDYYKTTVPADGKMTVYLKATYRGFESPNNNNPYRIGINYVSGNTTVYSPTQTASPTLQPDSIYLDTIQICPLIAGTAYFRFVSSQPYEYEFSFSISDTSSWEIDSEYNNLFTGALPIAENEIKSGRLMYYPDRYLSILDGDDTYKTVLPKDGTIKVYVEAINMTCSTANRLDFRAYDRRQASGNIFTTNIGGLTSVPPGVSIFDTLYICGRAVDTMYFRFNAAQQFRYRFRYEMTDTSLNDIEPNGTFAEATLTGSSQTKNGHIAYAYNGTADALDYYKVYFGSNDSLKLHLQVTNANCTNNGTIFIQLYNKNQAQVFSKTITGVNAAQTVIDSLAYWVTAPDTIYIRINASVAFQYQFTTTELLPVSNYSLVGDTTACLGTYQYNATGIIDAGVTYNWSLPLGGGSISYVDSVATVTWTATGNRSVQLTLSNGAGSTNPRTLNVIVNGQFPTQVPVVYNFARTLSTNSLPPGATCQWYRNDTLIAGATDSTYYAADAGTFTVRFVNDCGTGPVSNGINFPAAVQAQSITFPHVTTQTMSPTAKVGLQATASSSLPVFYQKISGPGNVINDTVFITGVGTIIVKATQPGDDVYSAATPVFDTITIQKGDQLIVFDSIPNQILDGNNIPLSYYSSVNLPLTYTIIAGNELAQFIGYNINKKGAGTVTVRATQNGNGNYNPATPVERSFCIGLRTLTPIVGDTTPCLATYMYLSQKIPGANFVWTLSGGGILTTNNDTAWVQWQTPGNYTLSVKANSPCDTVYTNLQTLQIGTSSNVPGAVSNMQPANFAVDQQLPLTLSWVPGGNTVSYDLYVWDSTATQPATPFAADLTSFQYTIPLNSGLPYNQTYKWRVVSKNPCSQTSGPIQHFRLIPLPDLVVSDVQAPSTATAGQNITISWKVTNMGPGNTLPGSSWYDGVYLALDTLPFVSLIGSSNQPAVWNTITANGKGLLLGKKIRPSSLQSGQFYTNSLDFTIPLNYNFPVYVYVITDDQYIPFKILQVTNVNDTARKQDPMVISPVPVPDFRVDSVFAPATTFSGSTINLSYKVKNYGVLTPANSSWRDSVFISQSPLFNRNDATLIYLPKANGSYYPNAIAATISNNSLQILADSFYTRSVEVVIPNKILGTWFIYVKANASVTAPFVYEGELNNNNINRAQIEVYLTPTPKLTVSTLNVPVTNVSTTQPVGANWTITNEGFTDNFEKNKGHYLLRVIGNCPCILPVGSPPNTVCVPTPKYFDSLAQGSSFWIERVYLSADSSGLNIANSTLLKEVTHGGQLFPGLQYPESLNSCDGYTGGVNVQSALKPGANFPTSTSFNVPSNLQPGNYYIYVYTNPTKTVFEYPGTPQIKRSALPITVQRPDVVVSAVSVPANSVGGQALAINYSVLNNGPGAVFNHIRNDRLYISNFPNFDASAQVIGTQTFTESLPAGTATPHSFVYNIPPATSGNKYFYVQTNYDSTFSETNPNNNLSISAGTLVSVATPADLVVSTVQPSDTVSAVFSEKIIYTVTNNGAGTTAGNWTDSVFISCSSTFSPANSYYIGKLSQARVIPGGSSYSDSITLNLKMGYQYNSCFPEVPYSNAYFYVKANANAGTYEGINLNNNVGSSGSRTLFNPLVDHIVTAVNAPDTTTVGFAYPVNWRVKNIGYNPDEFQYYYYWQDGIFFSTDSIADASDKKAGNYLKYFRLNRNQDSLDSRMPLTPNLPTGDYYVYVNTNYTNNIPAEKDFTNNVNFLRDGSGFAKKIHVIQPNLADLTDSIIAAPSSVAAGQPISIIYKITNIGSGTSYPGANWQNILALSDDFNYVPNQDRLLTTRYRTGALLPGHFYYDTVTVTIPATTAAGNYVLIGKANSNNIVVESASNNNLGFHLLNVFVPPVTDLIVSDVMKPDTVLLGYSIDTVKWVITNNSLEEASGYSTDGIYLSAGSLLDSTATLIGIKNKNITIQPQQSDTTTMSPMVSSVVEGNYNVFVRTDLLNNILESDKTNNTGMSTTPVYVKVKELLLDVPEFNTLQDVNRFYKLRIPDSLLGSTILVTLQSGDSLTMLNEMFIGGGFVPTAAQYDYRFETPNYGNQAIVMNSVTDSVYYIMVRCVSPNPVNQNITLKAVKLPFAILNVHTNSGGNIGNVTVRIKGSLFSDSMVAKLSNGGTTIYSSAVYFTNSTQVFATFNLQGKPVGIYDVTLIKPDSSTAVLASGFSIVPANNGGLITGGGPNTGAGNGNAPGCDPGAASGYNSQLVVDMIVPSAVFRNFPVVIVINYTNPTNFDIPAQSRILYSEAGMKLAFTVEGVPAGTTSLYLELTESGGPPGIIRAGGSGTITIHSRAPRVPPNPNFVLFKLK